MVARDGGSHVAPAYDLRGIVDRIGTGDAFAAGILHGLLSGMPIADTAHFGLAAACLKHSIPGDFNLVGRADVEDLIAQASLQFKPRAKVPIKKPAIARLREMVAMGGLEPPTPAL